jgi:hypothetical protein
VFTYNFISPLTNKHHGGLCLCRSRWLLHQSTNSLLFTEPEGQLLFSKEPSTCFYHLPNQSRPQLCPYLCHTNIHITLPSKCTFPTWTLPFTFSNYNFVHICYYSHACYMTHVFYLPSFYYVSNMCSAVQKQHEEFKFNLYKPYIF